MKKRLDFLPFLVLFTVFTSIAFPGMTRASIEIFPREKMIPGKMGVAYTVVEGTDVEEFTVEILGVLPNSGPSGDLVLIEASGDVIDRVGGIASGMSGSPIYVDGQLLGAIGYAYRSADQRIGLATPAEDMLAVLDLVPEGDNADVINGLAAAMENGLRPSAIFRWADRRLDFDFNTDAIPLSTPISLSGFGQRSARLADKFFHRRGTPVVHGLGTSPGYRDQHIDGETMLPGSPIAVQMVTGDVNMSAIGTLTATDGDRFIAFGHTISSLGDISLLASSASIAKTVNSLDIPFKIGLLGRPVGTVLQDRSAAVAGRFGDRPDMVTLAINVHDVDRQPRTAAPDDGKGKTFTADVVAVDDLMTPLMIISAFEAIDRGLDRLGAGTAALRFQIDGDGLPRPLIRENFIYSSADVAARSLWELYDALRRLQNNLLRSPEIKKVSFDVSVSKDRKTAWIERVVPTKKRIAAGEALDVEVTLQPYRTDPVTFTVSLSIPKDTAPGPLMITARGGDQSLFAHLASLLEEHIMDSGEELWDDPQTAGVDSFERLIEDIESQPKNNDIVFEFFPLSRGERPERFEPQGESEEDHRMDPEGDRSRPEADKNESDEEDQDESKADENGSDSEAPSGVARRTTVPEKTAISAHFRATETEGDDPEAFPENQHVFGREQRLAPVKIVHSSDFVIHGMLSFEVTVTAPDRPRAETSSEDEGEHVDAPAPTDGDSASREDDGDESDESDESPDRSLKEMEENEDGGTAADDDSFDHRDQNEAEN